MVGIYQRKLEEIAARGVELLTLVPPYWRDGSGATRLERLHTRGYRLETTAIRANGHFHLHHFPELGAPQHVALTDAERGRLAPHDVLPGKENVPKTGPWA